MLSEAPKAPVVFSVSVALTILGGLVGGIGVCLAYCEVRVYRGVVPLPCSEVSSCVPAC